MRLKGNRNGIFREYSFTGPGSKAWLDTGSFCLASWSGRTDFSNSVKAIAQVFGQLTLYSRLFSLSDSGSVTSDNNKSDFSYDVLFGDRI
jgi:hypothetical protein